MANAGAVGSRLRGNDAWKGQALTMTFSFDLVSLVGGVVVGALIVGIVMRATLGAAKAREVEARIEAEAELGAVRETLSEARLKVVTLETTLEAERAAGAEKLKLLDEAREKLTEAFKVASAEALNSNRESFLSLAKATLETTQEKAKGDLDKRQQAIVELVKPVREALAKFDGQVQEIEKARAGAYAALREQVTVLHESHQALRSETSKLVRALRQPVARGRWGEIQLRRVCEMAGMLEHCDFDEQASVSGEDGRLRPDMIVRLPGGKNIVVDAKAPLAAYLDAVEAPDEETRRAKLVEHTQQVRAHIRRLAAKSYWGQFQPAPEFVVLFLPGETFFSAALEHDPTLIESGVNEQVILATPTTLIALLKAVAYGWREEQLAENAREISELGQELHKRIADVAGHVSRLGKNLASSVDAYNSMVGSLESRVLVSARRFQVLGAASAAKEVEAGVPVERTPRSLTAPELVEPDEEAGSDGDGPKPLTSVPPPHTSVDSE